MKNLKMSDAFKDGCQSYNSYLVDNYTDPDNLKVIANFDMDYVQVVNEKMAHHAAHAINNHDRLVEENAELLKFVKSVEFTMAKAKKHNQLSNHDNEMLRQQIERANKILNKQK